MGRLEELRINAYLSEIARGYGNNSFMEKLISHIFRICQIYKKRELAII